MHVQTVHKPRILMAISMFKMKMDIDRHNSRLMPHTCQYLDPPNFLLPTTKNYPVPEFFVDLQLGGG
jgi:hypothetical protein